MAPDHLMAPDHYLESESAPQADDIPNGLRVGDTCPRCQGEALDYDGLLNLACLACGFSLGGAFT